MERTVPNLNYKTLYTVIVADDEDELRDAVCSMIPWEDCGFRLVGSASNGLDALQLVEKLEPDLLLTDIRMPFISGIELARQVREVRPATNIAFLSGFDDFEYAQQAIQYNIISYMLKPLTVEGLGAELRVIRQKIDAQFAMFRQAPSRADGPDLRAAMLMPLVLDDFAEPGGRFARGGLCQAVRTPARQGGQALLHGHGVDPSGRGRDKPDPSGLCRLRGQAGREIYAQRELFCLGQGHHGPAGQPFGF